MQKLYNYYQKRFLTKKKSNRMNKVIIIFYCRHFFTVQMKERVKNV